MLTTFIISRMTAAARTHAIILLKSKVPPLRKCNQCIFDYYIKKSLIFQFLLINCNKNYKSIQKEFIKSPVSHINVYL